MADKDSKKVSLSKGGSSSSASARSSSPRSPSPRSPSPSRAGQASKAGRQQAESIGFLAIVAGILIALNVIGVAGLFARADTTATRAFTLSHGSERVVRELDDDLTITAYFTSDLPPPFNATERYVRDILEEYEAASGGKVHLVFVDPDEDEEKEAAERAGVRQMEHRRIGPDGVSIVAGFRGLVLEYAGDSQVIAALPQDTAGLEYLLTNTIKQLVVRPDERPRIGVLSGHEGPTPTKGLSVLQRMLPNYRLEEVAATSEIASEVRALLVIEPTTEVTEAELRNIDSYVLAGGSLGVFGGSMKVAIDQPPEISAQPTNSGLNRLLEPWGVRMNEDIVADANCEYLPLRTAMGLPMPVPYPPAPQITFTEEQSEHPALFRLRGTQLFFASSIETLDVFRELEGQVLMQSSEQSWALQGEQISLRIRDPRRERWEMSDRVGPLAVAVALDAQLPSAFPGEGEARRSESPVRVMVVGTSTMMRDEFLGDPQQVNPEQLAGPMAFVLNAIDWLAQDSDLIAIRAKTIEEPALDVPRAVSEAEEDAVEASEAGDEAEANEAVERHREAMRAWDSRKAWYRWGNTLLIPLAFAAFGIVRWQTRQRKKANLKL
jgi:ABC-type uncharacterized transport system involved in gliding motility auxiliary subunit